MVGEPIVKVLGVPGDVLLFFVGLNLLAAALQLDEKKGRTTLLAIVVTAVLLKVGALQVGHAGL
jgi:hypothetical protein